jgi:ribonucleoside-diphosphate reductase alpha chain
MEYLGQTDFVHVKPTEDQDLAINRKPGVPVQMDMTPKLVESSALANAHKMVSEELPVAAKDGAAPGTAGALSAHLQTMMGDAPFCSSCGHTTVRNGACYKCLNCGNSMGCS